MVCNITTADSRRQQKHTCTRTGDGGGRGHSAPVFCVFCPNCTLGTSLALALALTPRVRVCVSKEQMRKCAHCIQLSTLTVNAALRLRLRLYCLSPLLSIAAFPLLCCLHAPCGMRHVSYEPHTNTKRQASTMPEQRKTGPQHCAGKSACQFLPPY